MLDTWPGMGLSCDLDGLYFDLQGFATRVVGLVDEGDQPGQEWLGRLLDLLLQLKKEAAVQQKAARAEGSSSWAEWCEKALAAGVLVLGSCIGTPGFSVPGCLSR